MNINIFKDETELVAAFPCNRAPAPWPQGWVGVGAPCVLRPLGTGDPSYKGMLLPFF